MTSSLGACKHLVVGGMQASNATAQDFDIFLISPRSPQNMKGLYIPAWYLLIFYWMNVD